MPTREEMEEIEESSRLYSEDGAAFMTAHAAARARRPAASVQAPVTFILAGERLVTVRYHEPQAFASFPARAEKAALGCSDGETVLMALLDAVVDRLADILEVVGRDIEKASRGVFRTPGGTGAAPDYRGVLQEIGRQGDLVSHVRDSLVTLERLIAFFATATSRRQGGPRRGTSRWRAMRAS